MELKQLVSRAINDLEQVRQSGAKKNYLVSEIILEVNVTNIREVAGKVNFTVVNMGHEKSIENSHKVTIKLTPKK